MAWAAPFDKEGRLVGAAQVLTLGVDPADHDIRLTSFRRRGEKTMVKAKDSGDWDTTDKLIYGTSMPIAVDTSGTAEGYLYLSETPDWVIDFLYAGGNIAFSYKPDGTTVLISGFMEITNFEDTYPSDDFCTFSFDYEVQGKPTVLAANITMPA